jgi:hypothetical protein
MKPIWSNITALIAVLVLGALVYVFIDWIQGKELQGGPQVVLEAEPDGVELAQAVEDRSGSSTSFDLCSK